MNQLLENKIRRHTKRLLRPYEAQIRRYQRDLITFGSTIIDENSPISFTINGKYSLKQVVRIDHIQDVAYFHEQAMRYNDAVKRGYVKITRK